MESKDILWGYPNTGGKRVPIWRRPVVITNLVFLIAIIVIAINFGNETQIIQLLLNVDLGYIALALFFQVLTYFCVGGLLAVVLRKFSKKISVRGISGLSIAKLFIDQIIPTLGVGGSLMVAQGFIRRGAARGEAMAAIVTEVVSRWVAFFVLFGLSLTLLWEAKGVTQTVRHLALAFSILFVLILLALAVLIWSAKSRNLPKWIQHISFLKPLIGSLNELPTIVLRSKTVWISSLFFQTAIFVLDAATLWICLLALEVHISFPVAFLSFMMASAIATLSLVPGGVGFFEGVAVGVLASFGVSLEAGIAATVLLRGLTTWLPMFPGLFFFRRELSFSIKE